MENRSIVKQTPDGFIEVGVVTHMDREYENLGAIVSDERIVVYTDGKGNVTTWNGKRLGSYRVVSRWTRFGRWGEPYTMEAIRIVLDDGRRYYGRYGSDWSQLVRARRVR